MTQFRKCPDCGQYQTVHDGPCDWCGSKVVVLTTDEDEAALHRLEDAERDARTAWERL